MENIDPWGASQIKNYAAMREHFGIDEFNFNLENNRFSERSLIMGHRDFRLIQMAMEKKMKFYAMTGLMPSGEMHLGNKAVMEMMIYFQSRGAELHIAVADLESYATRDIDLISAKDIAVENFLLNYIAMGLRPCNFYFQSENSKVQKFANVISKEVNFSEMKSIYGFEDSKKMLEINSPIIQASDILSPQVYGEPAPTIVPIGADQDPHIRLTRDITQRLSMLRIQESTGTKISIGGRADTRKLEDIAEEVMRKHGITKIVKNRKYRILESPESPDSRISFSIDLVKAEREHNPYAVVPPSSAILRLETGIKGGKMSKSVPDSTISLNETPVEAEKKIMRALTGGRESIEEQRKLGGNPYSCPVYELYMYHLSKDSAHLKKVEEECLSGERLCGSCKKEASELMGNMLTDLKEKREASRHLVNEFLEFGSSH